MQLNIMLVFGVKNRAALIPPEIREHLHNTIGSILNAHGKGSHTICVGGTHDHVHIFFTLSSTIALADLVREVKSRTTRWINDNHLTRVRFEWQNGYGAFSYSQSARENVIKYIHTQEEHHRHRSFKEEMEGLLRLFEVPINGMGMPKEPE